MDVTLGDLLFGCLLPLVGQRLLTLPRYDYDLLVYAHALVGPDNWFLHVPVGQIAGCPIRLIDLVTLLRLVDFVIPARRLRLFTVTAGHLVLHCSRLFTVGYYSWMICPAFVWLRLPVVACWTLPFTFPILQPYVVPVVTLI